MQNSNSWVWWVIGIVIIVVFGWWIYTLVYPGPIEVLAPVTDQNTTSTNTINKLFVDDQVPGKVAYISSVTLANGGFVVIMKNNTVIGAKYFGAGTNPGSVPLTQSTVEGESYTATLYTDKDDNTSDTDDRAFILTNSSPILDSSGKIIQKTFKATKNLQGLPS